MDILHACIRKTVKYIAQSNNSSWLCSILKSKLIAYWSVEPWHDPKEENWKKKSKIHEIGYWHRRGGEGD
jgi:hypothetical protein